MLLPYKTTVFRARRRPLATAVRLLAIGGLFSLCAVSPFAGAQNAASPVTTPATQQYDIAAGPLSQALTQFSSRAGIYLAGASDSEAGKQSPGLKGAYSVDAGFKALLAGTGLQAVSNGAGAYVLRQAPAEVQVLPTMKIQAGGASIDGGRTEGSKSYAPTLSSTAFKVPMTLRETPQTLTVVTQAAMKDFALTDIRKILLFTPGVQVSAERGPQAYYFQSRGNSMQIQYDGVPTSNRMGGRGEGITFDTATIDRIEVLHGASGLLTGPGKPGGTVNVIRKMPTETTQVSIEAGGDSWGGWRGVADVSGPLNDRGLGGRLVGVYENQDFYIDGADARHSVLYGVLGQRFGEHTDAYFGFNIEQLADAKFGSHYGLPSNIDGSSLGISRKKNLGADWSDQDDSLNTAFLRVRHEFSSDWSLHGILTYEDYNTEQLEANVSRPRDAALVDNLYLMPQIEDWWADTHALDLFALGRFDLFDRQHDVMFGFNGSWKDHGGGGYGSNGVPLTEVNIDTWDYHDAPSPYSVPLSGYSWTGDYKQYGAFAGTRLSLLDPLRLIIGARLSWVEQSYDGVTDNEEDSVSTWYGGLVWDLTQHLSTYASYSEIFEPHPIYEIDRNGSVLDPIVGENYEVGLKLEALDGRLTGALAVYRLDQDNLTETDYEGVAPGICGGTMSTVCSKASGLVRTEGFELSLEGEVARGVQLISGYTQFDRDNKTVDVDSYEDKLPGKQLHVATTYSAPDDRWSVGASARWQEKTAYFGDLYFMPGQSFRTEQEAYTIVGLFGGYQLTETLRINAAVDNLFDKKYFSGLEWPLGGMVYGDARKVSVTLRADF